MQCSLRALDRSSCQRSGVFPARLGPGPAQGGSPRCQVRGLCDGTSLRLWEPGAMWGGARPGGGRKLTAALEAGPERTPGRDGRPPPAPGARAQGHFPLGLPTAHAWLPCGTQGRTGGKAEPHRGGAGGRAGSARFREREGPRKDPGVGLCSLQVNALPTFAAQRSLQRLHGKQPGRLTHATAPVPVQGPAGDQ